MNGVTVMAVKILETLSQKTKLTKKTLIVTLAAFLGIILLIVSELIPSQSEKEKDETPEQTAADSYEQYAQNIEERLTALISQIDGAGKTKVMVTLECSDENVYAKSEKSSSDSDSGSFEQGYIIVESNDSQGGILLKVIEPKIRGVAVVCAGGDSPVVRQSITDTVTAVLDISSARVNIATMKNDNGG